MGETAAVRGNRATHLKPFEYTESQYNCNHFTYMHSHCPYHLHVVDHVEAELVLTANTTSTAHKHHPMDPPAHCPTLRYLQEEASLRGGHTERVCAATVCVDGAGLTSGGERTVERRVCKHANKSSYTHGLMHARTYITLSTYVLLCTRTNWDERWSQFVQSSEW